MLSFNDSQTPRKQMSLHLQWEEKISEKGEKKREEEAPEEM